MASKKKSKVTVKELVEKYNELLESAQKYVNRVRNLRMREHSTTPAVTTKDGKVGHAIVSIDELIATTKAGEILGFETRLKVGYDNKSIVVTFVEKISDIDISNTIRYGGKLAEDGHAPEPDEEDELESED